MSDTSRALMRLMTALADWEESRGAVQEEEVLSAWTAFRASFNRNIDVRLMEEIRAAFPEHRVVLDT